MWSILFCHFNKTTLLTAVKPYWQIDEPHNRPIPQYLQAVWLFPPVVYGVRQYLDSHSLMDWKQNCLITNILYIQTIKYWNISFFLSWSYLWDWRTITFRWRNCIRFILTSTCFKFTRTRLHGTRFRNKTPLNSRENDKSFDILIYSNLKISL